jgi:meso-butanediol dehydrogenase / (S,S)-butanediol dehydrogenase / diacetyl reductase
MDIFAQKVYYYIKFAAWSSVRTGGLSMKLEGKVALITGGGTGIGEATARRFVEDGARVCITGRRQEMLDNVVRSLPAGKAIACAGDVASYADAERMISTVIKFGGKLNILVNNAGMGCHGSIADLSPEDFSRTVDVNLVGPFLLMKAAIPHIIKAGGGSIINVASLAGLRCIPAAPAYCASKAGLIMLTQQAALDYGHAKIRCNVVCPGAVRTPMLEGGMNNLKEALKTDLQGAFNRFTTFSPLARVAEPSEIAGVCAFLAGEDSSFMTGAVLVADGGTAIVDVNGVTVSMAVNK